MEEKIGKVTLDLTWYPGEDLYSDGIQAEQELLAVAQNYEERELNQVIADRKSWPVLYHFSHIRQNILEWLPVTKKDRVLEIGSGCGAITGVLAEKAGSVTCIDLSKMRSSINASRNREHDNIRILVGNFRDIEKNLEEKFDYITLIGVFEYSAGYMGGEEPYEEMLRCVSRHLAEDGKLVLAIENRLGLKYWAGCTEDHVGQPFEGLENYPHTDAIRTFSRRELEKVFERAGGYETEFYYPYPDYKFPLALYSDSWLPKRGELRENFNNFDRPRLQLFNEPRVYDSLGESELFPEFSNSFLVVAQPKGSSRSEERILFTKYSNERSRRFAVRTEILEDENGRFLKKQALFPEGERHVKKLAEWDRKLSGEYEKVGLCADPCRLCEDGAARLAYVEGESLEEALDRLLDRGKVQEAKALLTDYLNQIREICSRREFTETESFREVFGKTELPEGLLSGEVTNIDMVCQNLILTETPTVIDYEWTFDFPVPCPFVLWRVIHYYVNTHSSRQVLCEGELYREFGITDREKALYQKMEARFQQYITGTHVPVRDLYEEMCPGITRTALKPKVELQIYFSSGSGYSEENSLRFPIREGELCCTVALPEGCTEIRLDPGNDRGAADFYKVAFDGQPVSLENYPVNHGILLGNTLYASEPDPGISGIPVPPGARELSVGLKLRQADPEVLDAIVRQQKLIEEMRGTKVWKLYQAYRNKIEKR